MSEWLLIDGYNVINNWQEFKRIREESLEHARALLVDYILEYSAFKLMQAIVVFDAQEVVGALGTREEKFNNLAIVFTSEGETADAWIERKTYELSANRHDVFVVTSDYAEQMMILGAGAYRISSRELRNEYLKTKKQIMELNEKVAGGLRRNEVSGRINNETLEKLELLRR
ncbi:MAG TPA: NYN domain-containing protein [Candidatus Avacidaminococcus intestinavium]|uniref:NYN domain-containing protein n=1 Tax=Candidatus Avacidaminococcus intestinavium TaxID=2840684 RepID=A0A9D1SL93_9FIRM|nr:NYN domain-containing protein [Candidatus Avacidaminococcus intestinavium]